LKLHSKCKMVIYLLEVSERGRFKKLVSEEEMTVAPLVKMKNGDDKFCAGEMLERKETKGK